MKMQQSNFLKQYRDLLLLTVWGVIIGILVGAIDALFGRVLLAITDFRGAHIRILLPFLAPAGLLILVLYRKFSQKALKGMTLVFETGFAENEQIPKLLVPLVMVSTWITHLFGGSAGREGVAVQIGATVAHSIGRRFYPQNNGRIFLIIGMAAGFGGLFQTPLAATFFALEVLIAGTLFYEALLPSLAAAFVASFTSHLLGLEKFTVAINDDFSFTPESTIKLLVVAVLFGCIGGAFAKFLAIAKAKLADLIKNPFYRIFIFGIILSIALFILFQGRYSGLGTNLIQNAFSGNTVYGFDFALKFILTILTLAAGYQGGEVTPLFSIGATAGVLFSSLFGLPVMLTAALGYAAVFGSATNTLLAPILIGVEVFGGDHVIPFVIVCSIAYVFNGNFTIYGKQRQNLFFRRGF